MPNLEPQADLERIAATSLPTHGMSAREAYTSVHDELMLDGNARMNLATFVTTWMEPEAEQLMTEAFDKNSIDHDEYPSTSRIDTRLACMVASLFHAPGIDPDRPESATGVSTIGSSEAVMLAGLALKWRWRAARRSAGAPADRPVLVLGSNVQVVWEKFCRYFDVEPRYLPVEPGQYVITPAQVREAVDENTIGVVAVLGTTFTGEYEDVVGIAGVLDEIADAGGPDVPIHVDAASGGFVAPFLDPDLEWDFRLPRVRSINVSGHKYGLTYPGIGFAVWRGPEDLPEELIFHVNYLGGEMPTFTLNFSRPGNQIIGQYYNFLRLGVAGYTRVMFELRRHARWLARYVGEELSAYEVISDGSALPVIALSLPDDSPFSVFDVSHELRTHGWQVPAYTMPAAAERVAVLRIVLRHGFTADLTGRFAEDLTTVTAGLQRHGSTGSTARHFAH
ncbi:glutamate decarboxylase [Brachybacterium huguangmaarense]|uniref:Glutamate decarboxylase n=1 Tax=Brachybacterium huguangmaarense TaxID=1652028 RepID=A0ABY6G0N9_9MICO|nr:glutamate decarboxylase [Brachybacterium huguangmaarense]UYG16234.1 glutamate decarboxylase [Brachybacterium huguangmaarense]